MQSNDILDVVISSLSRKRRRNRPQHRKLLLEQLESRQLLSASAFSPNNLDDWPGPGTMPAMVSDTSDVFSSATMILSGAEGEADEGILSVIIDNGDLEYSEQGRWFTRIGGYQGDSRYTGTSNGPSTATWQQTLLPGTYTVKASWFGDLRHANDAPYRIYDGDTLLAEVRVDQTQDAFGVTMGGSSFETLATVNINSGLLRVVLSNDASGSFSYVVADAVRIERLGPMAVGDSFNVATDTTLDVPAPGVLVNDVAAPGRILSATLVSGPQYGTAVLHEDGSFAYTSAAGFVGTDSFTYRAFDGTSESNVAKVTIHVQLPPVVDDQSVETGEGLALDVVLTGTDPTGRALTFSIVTLPTHGVLDGATPDLTYTPDTDYVGQDYFTFQVDNGLLTSGLATVSLTVHRINKAPVAEDDTYSTQRDTPLTVTAPGVLANDTDPDGDLLTATLCTPPEHGQLTLNADGSFSYTPADGFAGEDSFTYRASDGALLSNIAMVSLTVEATNRPPVAEDDAYGTPSDTPLTVAAPGVLGNDSDPDGDALTAVLVSGPADGTLVLNKDGSFTYTPSAGFAGADSFTYRASDGVAESDIATVSITVVTVEKGPIAHWPLDETSGTVGADATAFGNHLVLGPAGSEPIWGTGKLDGALIFDGVNDRADATNVPVDETPGGKTTIAFWMNWNGNYGQMPVSLGTYDLWISSGRFGFNTFGGDHLAITDFTAANYANKWIHVTAVFANADTSQEGWQDIWAAESKLYIDGVEQTLTQFGKPNARAAVPNITLGAAPNGKYNFGGMLDEVRVYAGELTGREVADLVAAANGLVAHWTLDETSGTVGADATAYGNHLVLGPADSEPIWGAGKLDGALIFDGVNDRADATNVPVDETPGGKNTIAFWMNWNGGNNQMPVSLGSYDLWIYKERFGFNTFGGDHLAITDFTAANYANQWIHVTAVFANADTSQEGWQDIWAAESKLYIDGVEYTLTQFGTPNARAAVPTITLGAAPMDRFFFGGALDDVRVYARKLTGRDVANLAGAETPVENQPPVADEQSVETDQNTSKAITLTGSDPDGDPLTYTIVDGPTNGKLAGTLPNLTYTPTENYTGRDSFTFEVDDGMLRSVIATVSIMVNAVNAAPIAVNDAYSTPVDTSLIVEVPGVLGNDSDPDSDPLTAVWVSDPSNGTLDLNADGSFTYTPTAGFTGNDSFRYRAHDGTDESNIATVTITVVSANVPENLVEMFARIDRRDTAVWGAEYLEDPETFIWQPETFMYHDVTTGHEVWKMSSTPQLHQYYYSDIGLSPWSADGAKMSFTAWDRMTQAYSQSQQLWHRYIWMTMNADGTVLRPTVEGAQRQAGRYFHWSQQTPGTWYEPGIERFGGGKPNKLYRSVVAANGVVTSTELLELPEGTSIGIHKLISADGRRMILGGDSDTFHPVTILPDGSAQLDVVGGYARNRNYEPYGMSWGGDEITKTHDAYMTGLGDDFFAMFRDPDSNSTWWRLSTTGTAADGGPLYTGNEWIVVITGKSGTFTADEMLSFVGSGATGVYVEDDGTDFTFISTSPIRALDGTFDLTKIPTVGDVITGDVSGAEATITSITSKDEFGEVWPENAGSVREGNMVIPWSQVNTTYDPDRAGYWSHLVPDRWGRHVLFSSLNSGLPIHRGSFYITVGPGVWDYRSKEWVVPSHGGGAQHHDWHGFTDWTVSSLSPHEQTGGYPAQKLAAQKYDDPYSQINLNTTYTRYHGGTEYTTLVRPGQSPDGTKASWHSEFLNGKNLVDIYWTVVHYPSPPTDLAAMTAETEVAIQFLPPTYTDRKWIDPETGKIDEINGETLYAREIKQYQVWRSASATEGWQTVGSVQAEYANDPVTNTLKPVAGETWVSPSNKLTFLDNPGDGVWYYAVTSREHSGLESDELSEIVRVTVSGDEVTGTSIVQAKGQRGFWTQAPTEPADLVVEPGTAAGHYRLNWSEPTESMARYYNVYYATAGQPAADQSYRIASLASGTNTYLDWLADPDISGFYGITAVDWYGNESTMVYETLDPLHAAAAGISADSAVLSTVPETLIDAALSYWVAAGMGQEDLARLRAVEVRVAELPGLQLAGASSWRIVVDANAAGHGWFVGAAPEDHAEFELATDGSYRAPEGSEAHGRMDLLTVVMHELGHLLGLDDLDTDHDPANIMTSILQPGQRRLP